MHGNVPVRFGRGRLDSLGTKGLAAYLMRKVGFDVLKHGSLDLASTICSKPCRFSCALIARVNSLAVRR